MMLVFALHHMVQHQKHLVEIFIISGYTNTKHPGRLSLWVEKRGVFCKRGELSVTLHNKVSLVHVFAHILPLAFTNVLLSIQIHASKR